MKVHEITDEVGDAHVRAWVDGRKVVIELGELPDEHGHHSIPSQVAYDLGECLPELAGDIQDEEVQGR